MNQSELITAVTEDVNKNYDQKVTKVVTGNVLKSFTSVTTAALKKGEQVQLSGLGIFKPQKKEATTGRNPATGAIIKIPAKVVPKFKAAKALKDALN